MAGRAEKLGMALFVAVVAVSGHLAATRPHGVIYVDLGDGRGPAAVRRAYDVSALEGKALSRKINEQMVGEARVLRGEKGVGVELGQFVTTGPSGQKVLACSVYDRVQMVFRGEGEATHGDAPEMIVEAPCLNSNDRLLWMRAVWIPVQDLLSRPTTTASVDYFDDEPVSLRFSHLGDQWPRTWVLETVELSSERSQVQSITIDRQEIREANPKSLLLEF